MGQKVNPHGLRVGVIADWNTTWYADKKEFSKFLKEDNVIRTFLKKKYYAAAVSKILIERAATRIVVTIYTARPGVIIGKGGEMLKKISSMARTDCEKFMGTKVYLTTWVKVKENWRDSDFLVRNFGYSE